MNWVRCPHCATLLQNEDVAADAWWGCPGCGGVFAAATALAEAPRRGAAQAPTPALRVALPAGSPPSAAATGAGSLYPPGPRRVPADLTVPGTRYRQRVVLLLVTLLLFFALYLGLVVGSGCLIVWSFFLLGIAGLPVALLALLVFLFLLKGLFKSQQKGKELRVEITEEEQPRLFAFIRRVCDDTAAPAPYRVFLDPEVNAAAFYEASLLGLLRPAPKNLLLGLGLVNVLTLSEFKAVLAHEFGHFAQSSMRLGSYVYVANRISRELVFGRDWLDNLLLGARGTQTLGGLIAWVCWGLVWGLRQGMKGLYYAINFLAASLSREMEFHADLVAVSVTGSEALVRGLARLDFAGEALTAAINDLKLAADHDLFSADLFTHQRDAIEYLRRQRRDPRLGEPPPLPSDPMLVTEVFEPEDSPPPMWADHPSNYDREQNAKRRYVPCPLDDRPAWLLFDDREKACEHVTWRLYRVAFKVPRDTLLDDPDVVQAFLEEERRAVTYDPRYHGLYDDRFLDPGELDDLLGLCHFEKPAPAVLEKRHATLYAGALPERAATYHLHLAEKRALLAYRRGEGKSKFLEFRGRRYEPEAVGGLLEFMDDQLKKDRRRLAEDDRAVFLVHAQMSQQLGPTATQALRQRYEFHLALQRILCNLFDQQERLERALNYLAGREGPLARPVFRQLVAIFREISKGLADSLTAADRLEVPPLWHVKAGARLGRLLWMGPLVRGCRLASGAISGKKIEKLQRQLAAVIERAQRFHFKSLGGILTLQEEISRRWLSKFAGGGPAGADEGE